jgi:hypothetical protein
MAAAAAPVGEQHHAVGRLRKVQMPLEDNGTDRDLHVNIAVRPLADRLIATHSPSGGVQQEDHLIVARRREIALAAPR